MGHFSKVQKGKNCRLRSLGFFSSFFFFPPEEFDKDVGIVYKHTESSSLWESWRPAVPAAVTIPITTWTAC